MIYLSTHKDKKGKWYVKYQNTTKRGFETKREAQQYESLLRLKKEQPTINIKFNDIANDYVNYKEKNTEYSTFIKVKHLTDNYILKLIKNKNISNISEMDVRKFQDDVSSLNLATSTKNEILRHYKAIFAHAKKFYKNNNDPTYILNSFKKNHEEKLRAKDKELCVWNVDDLYKFINKVDKDMYKELFIILFFTGLRLGEALALTWNDFDGQTLNIDKSITRKVKGSTYAVKSTKNLSSMRTIELGENLSCFLSEYKEKEKQYYGFNNNWFIFGRLRPLPQTTINHVKEKAIKLAGVKRIRIHDLRHSHATNLINDGINIVAISKRLGHSDINMTLKVYSHLLKKSNQELIENINKSSQILLKSI